MRILLLLTALHAVPALRASRTQLARVHRTSLSATPRYTRDSFPSDLAATDRAQATRAVESASALPPELVQLGTGALLAYAIYLGPDWVLAPLGWESWCCWHRRTWRCATS